MAFDMAALTGYGAAGARVAGILVLSYVVLKSGDSLIERVFRRAAGMHGSGASDSRGKTLAGLLKSALRYAVGTMVLLTVLDLVGIDTKALLGGAAVLGLAIGFGAQNLVRDVITGFFIIYERQYDVGDYITAAGLSGIVEEVGLRTTRLRDWSGDVHVIPNGLVDKTTNKSKAGSRALINIAIAFEEDARKAIDVIQAACDQMAKEYPVITDGPVALGVSNVDASGVTISVWARTEPLEHFAIEREMRLRAKEALEKAGIALPYKRVMIVSETDRAGHGSRGGGTGHA